MRVRNILLILGTVGLILVIVLNLHALRGFFTILSSLKWYVLALVIIVQLFGYYLNALYYRSILRVFNYHNVGLYRLFEGAMAANFVNYVVPSAGMAGAGFFSQVLSPEVPRGKGVLIQITRYALSALAVFLLLPIGIGLVVITGSESKSINHIAITASLLILAFALIVVGLVYQETYIRKFVKWLERKFNRLFSKLAKGSLDRFVDDFFIGFKTMARKPKTAVVPFSWSLIYILEEILTLYLIFLAFGKVVNPGIPIMGYVIANISSVIGGAIFSVGVFELGMLGTFVALGESFTLALSVTLVYRVMNLIIGLPPGFIFYRKFLRKT